MAGRAPVRTKFSRLAMELRLQSALEEIERRLKRDYNYQIHLPDPLVGALGLGDVPNQQLVLIGQWIATRDLLDDIRDDIVRA